MKRLPLIPTIIVTLAVATMIGLGIWQLQRSRWKGDLLATYAAAQTLPPIAFPAVPDPKTAPLFRRSSAFCLEVIGWRSVSGRDLAANSGWSHIAECKRGGGEGPGFQAVMGWSAKPENPAWRGGPVTGIIAPDSRHVVRLVATRPAPGLRPSAPPSPADIPNNHLAYAVQWFLFAAIAAIIYIVAGAGQTASRWEGGKSCHPPARPLSPPVMRYISTRGAAPALEFEDVTLAGLASDGGLYVPESWPSFSRDEIAAFAGLSYVDTAVAVMRPFVGDALGDAELKDLCTQAYGRFAHAAVTPLVQLDQRHWLLELFHGPTLAFKDVALQLLGLMFERFLANRDTHLTIIGATSGDTGSAAIDALAGRAKVDVFMLHPAGRISDVQRRQMTTVLAPNIHNIAIDGSFDDAQALVKGMFADPAFAGRFALSAVNSINWARLMAQVVYYVYAAVRLGAPDRPVAFSVPTGNFGDVFAGYVAAKMGLPVARLIVATNVNDILHRALTEGDYSVGTVTATATPSMDIQVSSNFERLLFDLGGRDGVATADQMRGFEASKAMRLTNAQRDGTAGLMTSARIDADDMALAMRWASEQAGHVIDPHSAVGLAAARAADLDPAIPIVTLATAHPAKFRDAVERATGSRPSLPARVGDLFAREERCVSLPATHDAVTAHIAGHATPR